MGFYAESFNRYFEQEAKRKKEEQLNDEIRQLRNEIKSLKKINTREEVTEKIKTMLINDDILDKKVKEITDYLMYLLERENK